MKVLMDYFKGDVLAADVWAKKYALKDSKGNMLEETPDDMHRRLASEFARIEAQYPNPMSEDLIFELIKNFKYIVPQGSPMFGIGNNNVITSLSNCFVIGNNMMSDSYGSIMRTDEEQIQLMKRRGGVGHDLSHLRPSGAFANNFTLSEKAGVSLYVHRYSNSTREVAQDGRRGALMLTIDVRHPDTDKFVNSKVNLNMVNGANISVRVNDEFMKAVENDTFFVQHFPVEWPDFWNNEETVGFGEMYESLELNKLYMLGRNSYAKKIRARELWDKIMNNAYDSAEPGVIFWDKIKSESIARNYGKIWEETSTNPCGEIPLCPYDSCRLLAVNLYSYVIDPFKKTSRFDFDLFNKHVTYAQRMMDDLVDLEIEKIDAIIAKVESDPEPYEIRSVELTLWKKIRSKAEQGRRTGLGVTAEGDMLAALNLRYGSNESIIFSSMVHKNMAVSAYKSTITMAQERGAFPIWDRMKESKNPFLKRILNELKGDRLITDTYRTFGRRNISLLTIAPTGTTSLMTQTTSGIEPLFIPVYKRRRKIEDENSTVNFVDGNGDRWEEYVVIHEKFKDWYYSQDTDGTELTPISELTEEQLQEFVRKSPYFGSTTNDIDWLGGVHLQGEVQKWVDHSISKTINLHKDISLEEIKGVYMEAWKSGCKGVTIYRDGSRTGVLVKADDKHKFEYQDVVKRPRELTCDIHYQTAMKQKWMILVGMLDNKPYEIFAFPRPEDITSMDTTGLITKVKSRVYNLKMKLGGTISNIVPLMNETEQTQTRDYSLMLRSRINPVLIVDQIRSYASISSFQKCIEKVLMKYIDVNNLKKEECPECGNGLRMEEGCMKCVSCGYSKCG